MEAFAYLASQPWWYWFVAVATSACLFVMCAVAITIANLSPKSINESNDVQTLYIVGGLFSIVCGVFWHIFLMGAILMSLVCGVIIFLNKDK